MRAGFDQLAYHVSKKPPPSCARWRSSGNGIVDTRVGWCRNVATRAAEARTGQARIKQRESNMNNVEVTKQKRGAQ